MVDVKEIIKLAIDSGVYDTLGDLYSMQYLENSLFKDSANYTEKSKEVLEELKRILPIWSEKYGFDQNTELREVIKKIQ